MAVVWADPFVALAMDRRHRCSCRHYSCRWREVDSLALCSVQAWFEFRLCGQEMQKLLVRRFRTIKTPGKKMINSVELPGAECITELPLFTYKTPFPSNGCILAAVCMTDDWFACITDWTWDGYCVHISSDDRVFFFGSITKQCTHTHTNTHSDDDVDVNEEFFLKCE